MDAHSRLRIEALSVIRRDTPASFWEEFRAKARATYLDAFAAVKNDPQTLAEQKLDQLLQQRHFQMEKLLVDTAERHGLSRSLSAVVENKRRHAFVFRGDVAMTQSYVQEIGRMPQPAKFREKYAKQMGLPRLDLGDEPADVFVERPLYGLVTHNPIGRRFTEADQRLGEIQFCLPAADCKKWTLEFTIPEILEAYPDTAAKPKPKRSPVWKERKDDKGNSSTDRS